MPPPAPPPPPRRPSARRDNRASRTVARREDRKKSKDAADILSPSLSSSFSLQAPQPRNNTSNPTFVTGSDNYHHINQPAHNYSAQQQQQPQRPNDQLRQPTLQRQQQERPPKQFSVEEAYGPDFYGSKELGFCYLHPDEQAFWLAGNEAAQRLVLGPNANLAANNAPRMADPFEVRMRFSGQLQHLNATVVSAQKAAQYAVKYRDLSEDLHSCILEQLEKVRP